MFDRALALDLETVHWYRIGDYEEGTLFPARSLKAYAKATEDDRLVLSGVTGLSLVSFRQSCPLLSRSRFGEYGFQTFNESCAFVGAYVVGHVIRAAEQRLRSRQPSFEYVDDGVLHSVAVGGSFHGDFRMTETQVRQADIMSPINTMTEFGPQQAEEVAGYHSVEPDIVAALIEAEFLSSGKAGAEALIDNLIAMTHEDTSTENSVDFRGGAFADYGDGDVRYSLVGLQLLLTDEDYRQAMRDKALHSTPHLPQSSTLFEIIRTDNGVQFQNRNEKQAGEVGGIRISREHYVDLFRALISQTAGGLGRTAPSQLVELIYTAKKMVTGELEDL